MDAQDSRERVTPESVSTLFRRAQVEAAMPATATIGIRGKLNKLGFTLPPTPEEQADRERALALSVAETTIRQGTYLRAVGILVANSKGTSGKTPTTLALAGAISSVKGGSTAAMEVAEDANTLNHRAEGDPLLGMAELVRDVDEIHSAGQLHGYAAPQTSYVDVFGSTGRREELDATGVVSVSRVIDEYYRFRVMDSGNTLNGSAFSGAVSVADVLVIPVMMAGDSALKALELIAHLREQGGHAADLASHAIALRITDGRDEDETIRGEVIHLLERAGITHQFDIPYDRHIAERGEITWNRLEQATREAFLFAAADVIRILQDVLNPVPHRENDTELIPAEGGSQEEPIDGADIEAPAVSGAVLTTVAADDVVEPVPAPAQPVAGWVTCPQCGESVPGSGFCGTCGHQLSSELNLDKIYGRSRRAAGYAEPGTSLPPHLGLLVTGSAPSPDRAAHADVASPNPSGRN